jgi:hypothetical protein
MKKIDAAGGHQIFGDDAMNFDLQLEKFVRQHRGIGSQ